MKSRDYFKLAGKLLFGVVLLGLTFLVLKVIVILGLSLIISIGNGNFQQHQQEEPVKCTPHLPYDRDSLKIETLSF